MPQSSQQNTNLWALFQIFRNISKYKENKNESYQKPFILKIKPLMYENIDISAALSSNYLPSNNLIKSTCKDLSIVLIVFTLKIDTGKTGWNEISTKNIFLIIVFIFEVIGFWLLFFLTKLYSNTGMPKMNKGYWMSYFSSHKICQTFYANWF